MRTLLTQFLNFRFQPHKANALIFNHKSSIVGLVLIFYAQYLVD